jgi:hypothetical protein
MFTKTVFHKLLMLLDWCILSEIATCVVSSDMVSETHHITRHNMPIHDILLTAPQLSISWKALGTLPEDGNVMPKHVGATIHN